MKALITGGAGFLGSHLSEALLNMEFRVSIVDDFSTGDQGNIAHMLSSSQLRVINGSILNEGLIDELVQESDFVFHLAAAVGVFNIVNQPMRSLITNIRGSESVIDACVRHTVPFLVTSTSEIYGKNSSASLSEEDDRILGSPLIGRWTYSEAKAIEEFMAFNAFYEHGIPSKIVRLFNTVGPRQKGAFGMVLPRFVRAALRNESIEIFGTGNQTRCFGHVSDVVAALLKVAFTDAANGQVYNVGNPSEISINDLAEKVVSKLSSNSVINHIEYELAYQSGFEDMQRRVPDISKISRDLGWVPQKSLDDIIDDLAAHERLIGA